VAALGELDCDRRPTAASICCLQPRWVCTFLSDEGKFLRRQLLLALTEDDRLHTQEVQRLWNLVKDDLKPTPVFLLSGLDN